MREVTFVHDNNTKIQLIQHPFSDKYKNRYKHEIEFRRIHSYLIKYGHVKENVIDLGAWIGDNSIPWAKQISGVVYAIDPSIENLNYIRDMSEHNNTPNVQTIHAAISDKRELLYTPNNITHCTFNNNGTGNTKIQSTTLDHLYEENVIDAISMIHLDVEGFEFKVVKGAVKLIDTFKPVISFEQHTSTDDYIGLSKFLHTHGYDVFLIDEILPGCRSDCRNFFAYHHTSGIDATVINNALNCGNILKRVIV
jgi:FkbM family methyltransferase